MNININFNGFQCYYSELTEFLAGINWRSFSTGEVLFYDTASQYADYDFAIMEINHQQKTVKLMAITSDYSFLENWYCDAVAYHEVEQKVNTDIARLVLFAKINEYDLINESELTVQQYELCKATYHKVIRDFKDIKLFKEIQEYISSF